RNQVAVIAMRFANNLNTVNVPRRQILIYSLVQMFDFMLPAYLTPTLHIFDFERVGQALEYLVSKSISNDILLNNHTNIERKKKQHEDFFNKNKRGMESCE
ncbi:unnamed protein product, partial [Rotaria magnacalcarata]